MSLRLIFTDCGSVFLYFIIEMFFVFPKLQHRKPVNIMNAGLRDMQCLKYERGQISGIDAIQHHTGPRIPIGK